jgi:hypothetical protein
MLICETVNLGDVDERVHELSPEEKNDLVEFLKSL